MDKIVSWLESCGYSHREAIRHANDMIERNRWDGLERCTWDFAVQMILDDIADAFE